MTRIRKIYSVILLSALLISAGCSDKNGGQPQPEEGITSVSGTVACGAAPVAGAVVSDGYTVVRTDDNGNYAFDTDGKNGYVFLSIPSGYEVAVDGVIPRHFVRLEGNGEVRADFELEQMNNSRFNLFACTDIHLSNSSQDVTQFRMMVVPRAQEVIAMYSDVPLYGVSMGDMTTDSRWYKNNFALPEYLAEVAAFGLPFFHTMGNHDNDPYLVGDWLSADTYRKVIGPNYYSFNIGNWHCVSLDNIIYNNSTGGQGSTTGISDYVSGLSDEVLAWLDKDLSFVDAATPVLIITHCSLANMRAESKTKTLAALEKFDKALVLSGHHHCKQKFQHTAKITEHNQSPVPGVNWELFNLTGTHITNDGTPGGFVMYCFDGNDVKWKFYTVDHGDYQFRTFDMNTVPAQYGGAAGSNKILINVFEWDEAWSVNVKQNGQPLTVTKVSAKDPLYHYAADTFYGDEESGVRFPKQVTHMFSATATDADSPLEITVTDRFGEVSAQTMTRPKEFKFTM